MLNHGPYDTTKALQVQELIIFLFANKILICYNRDTITSKTIKTIGIIATSLAILAGIGTVFVTHRGKIPIPLKDRNYGIVVI